MKRFAQLFERMDETNKTNAKVAAMKAYFSSAPPADCAWAASFPVRRKVASSHTYAIFSCLGG